MIAKREEADGKSALRLALEAVYDSVRARIIASSVDYTGVILYGTEETSDQDYPNCLVLMPLGQPKVENIKKLKALIEDDEEFGRICKPSKSRPALGDVLYLSLRQFQIEPRPSKRLVLITDNDNPHEDPQLRKSAKTRAKDLTLQNVQIVPTFVSYPDAPFDTSKFYDEVDFWTDKGDTPLDPERDFEDIQVVPLSKLGFKRQIVSKHVMRRTAFHNAIELPGNIEIGVKGYNLLMSEKEKRYEYVYTGGEKPVLVEKRWTTMVAKSSREVKSDELQRAFSFGGETVGFTEDQLKEIRASMDTPRIRVIGFKPSEWLKDSYNIKQSTMIYPTDEKLTGSIRAFSALYQTLNKKSVVALAWAQLRRGSNPMLCALVPSEEVISNDDGLQKDPPGLHVVTIPFADDIRQTPQATYAQAPEELVALMRNVSSELVMKGYNYERFTNPKLQWYYRVLQAQALGEELPQSGPDATMPKYKSINTKAGEKIAKFNESLLDTTRAMLESGELVDGPGTQSKRSAPKSEDQPPKKKAGVDVLSELNSSNVAQFTLPKLKEWANKHDLAVEGTKKADYCRAIEEYLSAGPSAA